MLDDRGQMSDFRFQTSDLLLLSNYNQYMNRITQLFEQKQHNILSVFYTAGYPQLNDTLAIAASLQAAGADMLEIGFPFSDPMADGPVIQRSSEIALENGMSIKLLLEHLKDLRKTVHIPILLMGYFNPVVQYGVERFCKDIAAIGIDGLILPDLPMVEYETMYRPVFEQYHLSNIFLVTPQSSEERIRKIDSLSNGFVYLLSSSSITGRKIEQDAASEAYFKRIQEMGLRNPLMIGFGIADKQGFDNACRFASGAIVGSAFVKELAENGKQGIAAFVRSFR